MLKDIAARSPLILGVGLVMYAVGGALTGDLELQLAGERLLMGLSLLGFHFGSATAKK